VSGGLSVGPFSICLTIYPPYALLVQPSGSSLGSQRIRPLPDLLPVPVGTFRMIFPLAEEGFRYILSSGYSLNRPKTIGGRSNTLMPLDILHDPTPSLSLPRQRAGPRLRPTVRMTPLKGKGKKCLGKKAVHQWSPDPKMRAQLEEPEV
jgi:hypothetical protein